MASSPITRERAKVASLTRIHPANHPDLLDARRRLAVANLEQYIGKITTVAPPLTDEQRAHLAALIREGATR